MLDDLACTVGSVAKSTPGGILVFFPSYALMNKCYEQWERAGTLNIIQKYKVVYREPKIATEY